MTHLLNVVVEASDGKAGVVVILPNALWVLSVPGERIRPESVALPGLLAGQPPQGISSATCPASLQGLGALPG